MPRPNHDIPNLILGGIRDYAEQFGDEISVDQAHTDLLARGLQEVGILESIENHRINLNDGEGSDDTTGDD